MEEKTIRFPGVMPEPSDPEASDEINGDTTGERIISALRSVYDPELPVNIYDLGLIYGIDVTPSGKVTIRMTLTAPACPVAGTLPTMVEQAVARLDEVAEVTVELVWDPPWTQERMSDAARLELGLL